MNQTISVLVVDDSAFMRKLIINFLDEDPAITVAGFARNGEDALQKAKKLRPDVITLDVEMPILNGLDALKRIMDEIPTPVVMLSSLTEHGTNQTMEAMENGAVDFVAKPSGTISLDLHKIKDELLQKVHSASRVPVSKLKYKPVEKRKIEIQAEMPASAHRIIHKKASNIQQAKWNLNSPKLICIGTSTGGPRALQEVLSHFPADIKAPILVVQHMPAGFTKSLAARLNQLCDISVKEAEDGEIIKQGVAYIAPGGFHLNARRVGTSLAVHLSEEPPRSGHRPSVDVMLESVSEIPDYDKICVIMTGMGSDGAKGLVKLKENGNSRAIAESQNTCIVFGMPKAAIGTNLVDDVEDLGQIAYSVMKYMP
ncbi:protein-glutamate methylesterase/protein-glutamine glutaminase [Falsibacillus pallidus]|uniref:Protein-glutamate methylesterase/protein-glutamine glutaminase n=1 Tax=Falsibacillus pallidus TaxID=493781 RepID=A0A370GUT3_9BACI|nr:chemotaxis response regulator protein-glutamate methylesterase [Falsibacillus pallidus]RDI47438.1 two-component system chemotaxis response regulator CheB [Falsibacillus pallidus]